MVNLSEVKFNSDNKDDIAGLNPYNEHFDIIGYEFQKLLLRYAGLRRTTKILDVGCGTGRLLKPLLEIIPSENYFGIDVNPYFLSFINSTQVYQIDVKNDEFNPNGTIDPSTVVFPFKDCTFDLTIAVALFNHMMAPDVARYISQMTRVTTMGGIIFFTIFLINPFSIQFIESKADPTFSFEQIIGSTWVSKSDRPCLLTAHDEYVLRQNMMRSGLQILEPIRYGHWWGSETAITGHDVIIAKRIPR